MHHRNSWAAALVATLAVFFTAPPATAAPPDSPASDQQCDSVPTTAAGSAGGPEDFVITMELREDGDAALANEPEDSTLSLIEQKREEARQIATGYLGTPYRWGGTTPQAFDCSGFTRYVYAQLGVSLPRTARQQYKVGEKVKCGYWDTGDLVFFDMNKGYVSHVGMYLADHSFIHAANRHSGVRIDTLKKPSYKTHYVGARRHDLS